MRIFMTGASGLLGRAIAKQLLARGDSVIGSSRSPRSGGGITWVVGDPAVPEAWVNALAGTDAVIHLAGESIGDHRWNDAQRAKILNSRVDGTRGVVQAIGLVPEAQRPRTLVVANGIDGYAFDESELAYGEDGALGTGFLPEVCARWQAEGEAARTYGVRVATLRTGVVLAREGGALSKLLGPFRAFVGGRIGSGRQWFSWIHVADAAGAYLHALDHAALGGVVNVVAPGVVRQAELAKAIGRALHRPSWLPVPRFAVKLAAGDLGDYLVQGRRAVPRALTETGFVFRFPEIGPALADLV